MSDKSPRAFHQWAPCLRNYSVSVRTILSVEISTETRGFYVSLRCAAAALLPPERLGVTHMPRQHIEKDVASRLYVHLLLADRQTQLCY